MGVFRVPKVKNYTVMANHHLRDKRLSNKAKGILSTMLMLPEDWDYTMRGLTHLSKDGLDSIRAALQELENNGYLVRTQVRDSKGLFSKTEYTIFEEPQPMSDSPILENPITDKASTVTPSTEKPMQINTKSTRPYKTNTDSQNTILSNQSADQAAQANAMLMEMNDYRDLIMENIDYDILFHDHPYDMDCINEMVDILVETVCSKKPFIRIAGEEFPQAVVKSRLLKLDKEHIEYVLDCLHNNTTQVRNIRQYLLTTLYNAPATMGNYYSSLVNYHSTL